MGLIEFILLCVVVGFVDWLVIKYTPIPDAIKNVIVIASVVVLVIILLSALGVFRHDIAIPRM